jgi:hypothetical protein
VQHCLVGSEMCIRDRLKDLWYENREERASWGNPTLSLQEYFQQYKWWLRREYRFQQRNKK